MIASNTCLKRQKHLLTTGDTSLTRDFTSSLSSCTTCEKKGARNQQTNNTLLRLTITVRKTKIKTANEEIDRS